MMKRIPHRNSHFRARIEWVLFVVAAVFVYFFGLDSLPLLGPDEPRYSQVAREMFESGDWVTPTLGGFEWFEKPALLYWLQISFYGIFGVSELSARFGSAVFGLLTILTIYLLARHVEKNEECDGQTTGLSRWAFIVGASSAGLLVFSRAASFDIILTFPVTAALACFFVSQSGNQKSGRIFGLLAGFYFFTGLALLAKGLVGLVLPLGIVFSYFLVIRRLPDRIFLLGFLPGILLTSLVAGVWYAPMYAVHGWQFIDEFFVQHHFARYTSNKYAHPQPFWFFWLILPGFTLPWLPFFLASVWSFLKPRLSGNQTGETNMETQNLRIFALVWLLFPLLFFSFSGSKLPGYILPALPAAVLLSAQQARLFARKTRKRELGLKLLASATLTTIVILLIFVAPRFAGRETVKYLIEKSNRHGYADARVLNFHDIFHSLEFYASDRLVRTDDGKQKKFNGTWDIQNYLEKSGEQTVLVVTPRERLAELSKGAFMTETIDDNGEFAIVAVSVR